MRVWVGYHSRIGVVIYDPSYQAEINQTQVQLWDVNRQELKLFEKTRVRQGLCSLKAYLLKNSLAPLVDSHGIVEQIAKRYFQRPPSKPTTPYITNDGHDDSNFIDYDYNFEKETQQIIDEISEDQDAWARSGEEGWFYED